MPVFGRGFNRCCCNAAPPCDLCSFVALVNDQRAAIVPTPFDPICDYCGNLCGTLEQFEGFFGTCNLVSESVTFTPGLVSGTCGWRCTITIDGCTLYLGIIPSSSDPRGYQVHMMTSDYSSPVGAGQWADSYTCDPMHLEFDIDSDTSGGCGDRACTYTLILDEC